MTVETRQLVPSTLYFKQASPSRGGDAGGGSERLRARERERERKAGEFRNSSVTSTRPTRFPRGVSDTPAEQRETLEPDITELRFIHHVSGEDQETFPSSRAFL